MSDRVYPASVDVAIVGSGPAGATYARILSERAPAATIAMFEVGPTVSDPPGAHVKNIADPDERARAQLRSEGPDAHDDGDRVGGIVKTAQRRARPGTFLLESVPDKESQPIPTPQAKNPPTDSLDSQSPRTDSKGDGRPKTPGPAS